MGVVLRICVITDFPQQFKKNCRFNLTLFFFFRRCVEQSKNPDLWEITGVQTLPNGQKSCFQYLAENVVLATGSYDKPNILAIEGENLDYVVHSLKGMEQKMDSHVRFASEDFKLHFE